MTRFATGTPRSEINLNAVVGSGSTSSLDDIFCFLGETEMGIPDSPILVQSEQEFTQKFGAKDNGFRLTCLRALKSGVKLRICRIVNHDMNGDATGAKATSTIFEATSVGLWGNKLKVSTTAGRMAGTVDIAVTLPSVATERYVISATPTEQDIEIANASLRYVKIIAGTTAVSNSISNGIFTGGLESDAVTAADYVGTQLAQTGIYSFDNVQVVKWIAAPDMAQNALDNALVGYAEKRNAIVLLRTPTGIAGDLAVKYRNCTTPYTGTKIDSPRAFMFTGGVVITHPTTALKTDICEIADVCIAISKKNKYGKVYESFAQAAYGKVGGALGVSYNLLTSSRKTESDSVFDNGLNAIVQDENSVIKVWGDNTLLVDFSALSFTGNVEYIQSLIFQIKPIIDSYIHKINSINTWRLMYREIKKVLDVYMFESSDNRPRTGAEIGSYTYQGDQNANKIDDSQLVVNTVDSVNSGIYKVILDVQLQSTMRVIRLDINASLQGVSVSISDPNA